MTVWKVLSFGIGVVLALIVQNLILPRMGKTKSLICDTFQQTYEVIDSQKVPEVNNTFIGLSETIQFSTHSYEDHCNRELFSFYKVNLDDHINTYKNCVKEFYKDQWPNDESIIAFFKSEQPVYVSEENGKRWSYLRNVCLDISSPSLNLYNSSPESIDLSQVGIPVSVIHSLSENDVISLSTGSNWIWNPSSDYDELLEQVGLLHAVAIHPEQYPPIHQLILPTIHKSIVNEIYYMIRGIEHELNAYRPESVSVLFYEDLLELLNSKKYICLNGISVVGRQRNRGYGGIFETLFDSYIFRLNYYKYFFNSPDFQISTRRRTSTVLYARRLRNADNERIINEDAIQYVTKNLHSLLNLSKKDISALSFPEMVKFMTSVDILLAATGPVLGLAVFLTPHSGVVEIMPENYRSGYFHHIATGSDLYYLAHSNFSSLSTNSFKDSKCPLSDEMGLSCSKVVENEGVYVPPITLWMIMTDMSNSVNHNKYHIFQYNCLLQ